MGELWEYAEWRRNQDHSSWFTDIDYVEYRDDRGVVAFLEVTGKFKNEQNMLAGMPKMRLRLERRIEVFKQIASALGVPYYLIVHDINVSVFHVYTILYDDGSEGNLNEYKRMTPEQHKKFIQAL